MDTFLLAAGSAFWLGIATAISPCPLATNIAAVSFIGRRVDSPRRVFLSGLMYTGGRTLSYLALGMILVAGLLSIGELSLGLQAYMNRILGPILILGGMVLLELIRLPAWGGGIGGRLERRAETGGIWTAGLLGVVFALSFCPLSAVLFFGSLVPLSVQHGSPVVLPTLYGIGTGLPVVVFAGIIAFSAQSLGKAFDALKKIEIWFRRITGVIFILVGVYYCLVYVFHLL